MFAEFHFLRPEWFFAIPLVAILLVLFYQRSRQSNGWEKVCDTALLNFQLTHSKEDDSSGSRLLAWLLPLMFLLTIVALAGPSWEKKEQPVFQKDSALVIVLDLSLSMNARDIKPSRLERAKLKIIDILKQKKEGQTALVAYAGDAHTVSPLTVDNKTIISLLPALDSSIMPLSGSHVVDALKTAKELLVNSGYTQGDILLFTDGIDASQQNKTIALVKQLNRQGYHTSIIGIGSRSGSPIPIPGQGGFIKDRSGQVILSKLNEQPLQAISRAGGGFYHSLSLDDSDFRDILEQKFADKDRVTQQDDQLEQWLDAGAYLTLLIIPMALLFFRKGILSIAVVMFLLPVFYTDPVQAQQTGTPDIQASTPSNWKKSWNSLWYTPDQQAEQAFSQKHFQEAAQTFENPLWKASAYYRAGNYDKAIEQYSQFDSADALYNKGNALANLQKFPEAISAYEEALKQNPQLEDAKKNRDYLKKLLEQQKQQQQSGQDSQKQQDKNKQSEQQDSQQNQSSDSGNKQQSQSGNSAQENQQEQKQGQDKQAQKDSQNGEQNKENKDNSSSDSEQNQADQKQAQSSRNAQSEQQQNNKSQAPQDARQPESSEAIKQAQKQRSEATQTKQEQSTQQQEKTEAQKQQEQPTQQGQPANDIMSQLSQEEQQSLKQWLQRIPDNPGELLRIKFRNNTLIKQRQQNTPEQYEGNPW